MEKKKRRLTKASSISLELELDLQKKTRAWSFNFPFLPPFLMKLEVLGNEEGSDEEEMGRD